MGYATFDSILERDIETLGFIIDHIQENGYPPSVREIAEAIGVSSPSTGHQVVSRLVRRGWITMGARRSRTIRVTQEGMDVFSDEPESSGSSAVV